MNIFGWIVGLFHPRGRLVASRPLSFSPMKLDPDFLRSFVSVASGQVGKREVGLNNGGEMVRAYMSSTWMGPSNVAWCAGFVCWCFLVASMKFPSIAKLRPSTPRAFEFEGWGQKWGFRVSFGRAAVRPGDVVVFLHSHVGIVLRGGVDGFDCIEGNSDPIGGRDGGGVVINRRSFSSVRSIIHLS